MGYSKDSTKNVRNRLEQKDDRNAMYPKLWNAANSRLIEKFVALSGYITKGGKFKISVPRFHMKQPEKDKQIKPTVSRREAVIRSRNHRGRT